MKYKIKLTMAGARLVAPLPANLPAVEQKCTLLTKAGASIEAIYKGADWLTGLPCWLPTAGGTLISALSLETWTTSAKAVAAEREAVMRKCVDLYQEGNQPHNGALLQVKKYLLARMTAPTDASQHSKPDREPSEG